MSEKKYLDLAGLQYYDSKWILKFDELKISNDEIDDILFETLGITPPTPPNTIRFGINTEASGSNERTTGIPFNLWNQDVNLTVDWGDNTISNLSSSSYTELNSRASIHTYANPGIYNVSISSTNWSHTYILSYPPWDSGYDVNSDSYDCVAPLYWWRRTLTSIPSALPQINGINIYTSPLSYIDEDTEDILWTYNTWLSGLFAGCSKLASIPSNIFQYNTEMIEASYEYVFAGCTGLTSIPQGLFDNLDLNDISECFYGCTGLTSIPSDLLSNTLNLYSANECFAGCTNLGNFELHIGSTKCSRITNFVNLKSGAVRKIYVPSGSSTETAFNSIASSLGLTVIGE